MAGGGSERTGDNGGEQVLCVPRAAVFPDGEWHGLLTAGVERVLGIIDDCSAYLPRASAEGDPSQQQIVPYCVVRLASEDRYLLTRRLRRSEEQRLHDRYSLGVGGHINPGDGAGGDAVKGGLAREWAEEVVCPAPAMARLVGVLNDESNAVSQVHLGLVFLIEPQAGPAWIREQDKLEGRCLPLAEIGGHYHAMETWSQLVYDHLIGDAAAWRRTSPLVVDLSPAPI